MKTAQEVANELDLTRTEVYNLLRKKRFSPLKTFHNFQEYYLYILKLGGVKI
ncbi:hypothetical protein ACSXAM_15870 (plasmid) [Clostridium perfringens]